MIFISHFLAEFQFFGSLHHRKVLGLLYFSFGMVNNVTNNGGGSLGFVGNVSLKKRISGWGVESDLSYAQNVQTIIASYTTSNYSCGAALRRRFGANSYWSGSYRGLQSGLTQFAGYGNCSDSFVTIFHRGRYGLSGSYSQSHGTALLRTAGTLTPTQLAPLLQPDQTVYDGKVYGAGVNVIPLKKMLINVNWYPEPRIDHWKPLSVHHQFALHWKNPYLSCSTTGTCDDAKGDSSLRCEEADPDLPWPTDLHYENLGGFTSRGEIYVRMDTNVSDGCPKSHRVGD